MNKKVKTNLFVYSLIAYPLILFAIFYVATNFNSILLAFQRIDGTGKHFAGVENFSMFLEEAFGRGEVLSYSLINSVKMYLINLLMSAAVRLFLLPHIQEVFS